MDPLQRVLAVVYAVHDFQAENPDELSFSAGEAIQVTEKDDLYGDGWWQGWNSSGEFGLFPQAYTLPTPPIPPSSASISQSGFIQPTMNETLFEVQNAIDQLHLPSPSTSSFPHQASINSNSPGPSSHPHLKHDDDDDVDKDSTINSSTSAWDQNSNPTKARALLAEKAKADAHSRLTVMERLKSASSQLYSNHRASVNSSISVPDIGEIELSEESGGEDEHHHPFFSGSPFDPQLKNKTPSRPSTAGAPNRLGSFDHSSGSLGLAGAANQVRRQSSDLPSNLPFKPGPFSAAAIALGLTGQPKDVPDSKSASTTRDDSNPKRPHHAQKLSSGSVLSDIGLDLREHFNGPPAPLASTLRMSRESSQMTQPFQPQNVETLEKPISSVTSTDSAQDEKTLRPPASFPNRLPSLNQKHFQAIAGSHSRPSPVPEAQSPQEHLSPRAATRMASDSNLKIADSSPHSRQRSSSSVGSSVFVRQQLSSPVPATQPAPVPFQGMMTSASTADSSSHKGSRSRSSSRIGPFAGAEDQLTSPATSTFPSLSGVKPGGESSSSSHGGQNKQAGYGIKSTVEPNEWGVSDVVEWAKAKGLDEFTVAKFGEHEITGDVLLELEMNSLKEIDLVAFGRRVKVVKAIEDLKKAIQVQKQGHHHLPLSPNYDSLNASMLIESPVLGHFNSQPGPPSSYATRADLGGIHGRSLSGISRQESVQYRPQGYQPMGGEVSDREEELAGGHRSQKSGSNRFSPLHQGHSSKPSDASGLSYQRRPENETTGGLHREDHQASLVQHEYQGHTSTTTGRPRQATFSASRESVQMSNQQPHNRSKSISGEVSDQNNRTSRGSSWAPLSIEEGVEEDEKRDGFAPLGELEGPPESVKSSKRGKKKKLMAPKTPSSTSSKKGAGHDSPTAGGPGAGEMGSPEEAQGKPTRTSFLGNLRNRKPPPKISASAGLASIGSGNNGAGENERPSTSSGTPGSANGRMSRGLFHFGSGGAGHQQGIQVQGQSQHQIQHLKPAVEAKTSISSPISLEDGGGTKKEGEGKSALERIGKPDHQGWMRKKGEKYLTWKLRYFILKGANLYYLKSQNESRIKGLIKLGGYKVVMDADVHPGRYGFRIIHDNGSSHSFSADDSKLLREWMKAMMKATIDRDWVAPVISSCNIRTIPIREAQKMFPPPRPPSPTSRQRMQKARLAANGEMLTEKDAAVLMSMQSFTGPNGRAVVSPPVSPNVVGSGNGKGARKAGERASGATDGSGDLTSFRPSTADEELLNWINHHMSSSNCIHRAQDFSKSMKNGLVVVRLVEKLTGTRSGLEDERFGRGNNRSGEGGRRGSQGVEGVDDDEFEVYFCVFDYLNSQKIPLEGYSLNDMISGDPFKTRDFLMRIYRKFEG